MSKPWWELPYKKGPAVGPAKLPRVLHPPSADKGTFTGDDVLATKRIASHAQRWLPWAPSGWDKVYNERFAMGRGTGNVGGSGVRGFQRQEGLPETGVLNDVTYQRMRRARIPIGPREGDPILDPESAKLIRNAIEELEPASDLVRIRKAITDFCKRAQENEKLWHYDQQRPYTGLGVIPEREHVNDCSSYVILTYWWARTVANILIPDPSGYRYTGFGNTWDDLDGHPRVTSGNYLVGDLAHYDGHVTICYQGGGWESSDWSSFGWEGGPQSQELYYRPDFLKVVRPPLLPA